jgi:hypothetical protein
MSIHACTRRVSAPACYLDRTAALLATSVPTSMPACDQAGEK